MTREPYSMCPVLKGRCTEVFKSPAPLYGMDPRIDIYSATRTALTKWRLRDQPTNVGEAHNQ